MIILDATERDNLLNELRKEQREFIEFYVKRGKKTSFANVLALDKGMVLPESVDIEDVEFLLDDWVLEDYIDNGFVNSATPCECGKPLRYQYIVRHLSTNETRRFGITHFEEHTGLPASVVAAIKKGFSQIDYERDELLTKIKNGWSLYDHVGSIPNGIKLPKDIQQHIDAGIPLLERQLVRIQREIINFLDQREEERESYSNNPIYPPNTTSYVDKKNFEDQVSFIFNERTNEDSFLNIFLSKGIATKEAINQLLEQGIQSARVISELLIKKGIVENKRFISGKPKIYVKVCLYLDGLVNDEIALLVNVVGKEDRIYQYVKKVE